MEKSRNLQFIGKQIGEQTKIIGQYGYTIQNYEKLTSSSISGNAEEIDKAVKNMGVSYDEAKNKASTTLTEQITSQNNYINLLKESWNEAASSHDGFQAQILDTQLQTQQQELNNLATSLASQTSTVEGLTEEQKNAWINLASQNITAYNEGLKALDPTTREKLQKVTGLVVNEVELPNGTKQLAYKAAEGFELNYNMDGTVSAKLANTSGMLQTNTSVASAAGTLGQNTNDKFKENINYQKGQDATSDYMDGAENGGNSKKWNFWNLLFGIGKQGNQKMRDGLGDGSPSVLAKQALIDYFLGADIGIDKQAPKTLNKMSKYGDKISQEFTKSMNEEIIRDMQKAVAMETGSINATASVKSNNSTLNVIKANFNIDGSVDIDGQKAGRILAPNVTKTIKAGGLV